MKIHLFLIAAVLGAGSAAAASTVSGPGRAPVMVAAASPTPAGNVANGKKLYAANCAACHGATGTEGGVGPSLKNEKSRKNFAQVVGWVKNPTPPMPKLYPSPLSASNVNDVAAYIESL